MTVTAKEIQKCIDPRAKYLIKDSCKNVFWSAYKPDKVTFGWNIKIPYGDLGKIEVAEFQGKDWQDCCIELEPDYSQWIGKLCQFADNIDNINKINNIGILTRLYDIGTSKFIRNGKSSWIYCRPLKKSEVSFVESEDE